MTSNISQLLILLSTPKYRNASVREFHGVCNRSCKKMFTSKKVKVHLQTCCFFYSLTRSSLFLEQCCHIQLLKHTHTHRHKDRGGQVLNLLYKIMPVQHRLSMILMQNFLSYLKRVRHFLNDNFKQNIPSRRIFVLTKIYLTKLCLSVSVCFSFSTEFNKAKIRRKSI